MGDYTRSTRELTFENFDREIIEAVNAHIEKYNLGLILNDTLICVESNSEKIKRGLFADPGAQSVRVCAILTTKWLLQAIKADDAPTHVRSARLADLVVTDYEKGPFNAMIPDSGVGLKGHFTDASEDSSSFLGLGKDSAGEKFKQTIIKAVQDAKK